MAQEKQASLALIHCLSRGMTMAQAKVHLREAGKQKEETSVQPAKKKVAKAKTQGAFEDGPENQKPGWLE